MSKLAELRNILIQDLAVLGVPVFGAWPIRAEAPSVYLVPPLSAPYVAAGREFGSYVASLDAVVLVERRPPDEGREALELLLEDLLRNSADWALTGVDSPAAASMQDSTIEFLGTIAHLAKTFYL